jgi:hypothetical protein
MLAIFYIVTTPLSGHTVSGRTLADSNPVMTDTAAVLPWPASGAWASVTGRH